MEGSISYKNYYSNPFEVVFATERQERVDTQYLYKFV